MELNASEDYKDMVAKALINKYGDRTQMIKFVEEASELITELSKLLLSTTPMNIDAIRHEIVDVTITLHSLHLLFDKVEIEKMHHRKLGELTIKHNLNL